MYIHYTKVEYFGSCFCLRLGRVLSLLNSHVKSFLYTVQVYTLSQKLTTNIVRFCPLGQRQTWYNTRNSSGRDLVNVYVDEEGDSFRENFPSSFALETLKVLRRVSLNVFRQCVSYNSIVFSFQELKRNCVFWVLFTFLFIECVYPTPITITTILTIVLWSLLL